MTALRNNLHLIVWIGAGLIFLLSSIGDLSTLFGQLISDHPKALTLITIGAAATVLTWLDEG